MAMKCEKCSKEVRSLTNYGNVNHPLCFDCANKANITNGEGVTQKDDNTEEDISKESNRKNHQVPRYINPICVLSLTEEDALDRKKIRKAIKKLQAEITLSDSQFITYKKHQITSSDLHLIDIQLSDEKRTECHAYIYSTPSLLSFFEDAKPEPELLFDLEKRPDIPKVLPDFYANSYSIAYLYAIQTWDAEKLKLLNQLSKYIEPARREEAYSLSEKHLKEITQKIKGLNETLPGEKALDINSIKGHLKSLLFDSKKFDSAILPGDFDTKLDDIARSLRALSITAYNDFENTNFAMQLIRRAALLTKSPSLQNQFGKDLKKLHELQANADDEFRGNILNVIKNLHASVISQGSENINLYKFNTFFEDLFPPTVIESILQDKNVQFKRDVKDWLLKIISEFGYNDIARTIERIRPLFMDYDSSPFDLAVKQAKSKDSKEHFQSIFKTVLTVGGLLLFFFLLCVNSGPSTTTRRTTTSVTRQKQRNDPSQQYNDGYVDVGEYRCSQYHASKINTLDPSESLKVQIVQEEQYIENESASIEALGRRIERLSAELEKRQSNLISQNDFDRYNDDVARYNQLLNTYRTRLTDFNNRNTKLSSMINQYNNEVDGYNTYLIENCTRRR